MADQVRRPPVGLQARGRRFWKDTLEAYELTDGELSLLAEVCRTMDTLDELARIVAAEGATTTGSQGQKVVHPAVAEARQQRLALHRLLAALALPDEDGRIVKGARTYAGRLNARHQWKGAVTDAALRRAEGA